jgi:hypothetical protein
MAGGQRTIEQRVTTLERRMKTIEANGGKMRAALTTVQGDVEAVKGSVATIQTDTADILSIVSATKAGGKFVAKHLPRAVAAVSGAAVSAGLLNPKVGAFFSALFN